ncbi:MAG: uroporphyrinogen-III synthase [Parachlamydiales bacterium]|nr:uroporphyrinogen-III synthase [Parachlamydiales bacterium]
MIRTLYLGLRPKPGTFHYPVIRTEKCGSIEPALALWPKFTHIIFTSQTTVEYWPGPWDKEVIAIGDATAEALRKVGSVPLVAPYATQEGVMELISNLKGYYFLPHSKRARPNLVEFLKRKKIPFFALELYDTHFQCLKPIPNLDDFDEIVFTSPSTVEGFLRIYGKLPEGKKLRAIGPITEKRLLTRYSNK